MVLHETTNPCHQRRKTKLEGHKLLAQSAVGEALRRGRAPPAGSSRVTRCRRLSVPKGRGSTLGGGGAGAAPIVGLSGGARAVHVRVGTRIGLVSWRVVAMRGVLRAGFGRAGLGAAGSTSAHRQGPRARQARRPICMTVTAAQANGWRRAGPRPPVAAGGKKRAPRAARALRVGALCKLRGKSQQAWCPRSEYCQAVMGPCAKCASELSLRVCTAAAAWGPGEGQGPRNCWLRACVAPSLPHDCGRKMARKGAQLPRRAASSASASERRAASFSPAQGSSKGDEESRGQQQALFARG